MTTVTIYKSNDNSYKRFTCAGHSGYGKAGNDIVCASVSMLVINTINALEAVTAEEIDVESDEDKGFIGCRFKKELNSGSKVLMDAMVLGLQTVEEQYGSKYLNLKFKEV